MESPAVPFREALRLWGRVAALSFGGPAGQIAVMHRLVVEEKKWIAEDRFLHALSFCMLLPGPEAQQLAIYLGWLLHGARGGIAAGVLFVLPGFLAIFALSLLYVTLGQTAWVSALFFGLKAAVLAVVIEALLRIGRRALAGRGDVLVAAAAFLAIFFFAVPFPVIVAAAALAGLLRFRLGARPPDSPPAPAAASSWRRNLKVAGLGLVLWWGPLLLLALLLGRQHAVVQLGLFFSKTAVVTFGGAYAVLAYVAQQAVEVYGWLRPGEMLDGLGLAETTPGPLIQVVQFVAFLGAFRHPGALDPWFAAFLGSLVTAWVTFLPSFLWIFLGAPYVERLRGNRALSAALAGVTAAVVGVILNLAVWFSLHVLFADVAAVPWGPLRLWVPAWETLDPAALALALGAAWALFRWKWGMIPTLLASALLGLVYSLLA